MTMQKDCNLQDALNLAIKENRYNECLGHYILEFADNTVRSKGLYFKFTQFEVDFIIKPKIVDDLLVKCFKYDKEKFDANYYFRLICTTGVLNGITMVRREKKALFSDVYYYENMLEKLMEKELDSEEHLLNIDVVFEMLKQNNNEA